MRFFSLERPAFRWGDYGDILLHGMAGRDDSSGCLLLERSGPFVPPISFPGLPGLVVTEDLKSRLQSSGLTGISFLPVIKKHIARVDWHTWNSNSDEPEVYPDSGEPEDYILRSAHDSDLADAIPELWELIPGTTANVDRKEDPTAEFGVHLSLRYETWNGDDFFQTPEVLYYFVTERVKAWLEKEVGTFVSFVEW